MLKSFVNLRGQWINLDDCVVQNISEDMFGEDVVEYKYEGETHTAKVVLREGSSSEKTVRDEGDLERRA